MDVRCFAMAALVLITTISSGSISNVNIIGFISRAKVKKSLVKSLKGGM